MPRSNIRSSRFLSDSGNRTYIITTSRITATHVLEARFIASGTCFFEADIRIPAESKLLLFAVDANLQIPVFRAIRRDQEV